MSLRRHHARWVLGATLALVPLALAGCPASEDDPPFCNDSKCGPGVCQQFCANDAAKESAVEAASDAPTESATDGGDASTDDGATDAAADAPADGG